MTGPGWTKGAEAVAVLRRRWDSGRYLQSYARGDAWEPVVVPIKGPNARTAIMIGRGASQAMASASTVI